MCKSSSHIFIFGGEVKEDYSGISCMRFLKLSIHETRLNFSDFQRRVYVSNFFPLAETKFKRIHFIRWIWLEDKSENRFMYEYEYFQFTDRDLELGMCFNSSESGLKQINRIIDYKKDLKAYIESRMKDFEKIARSDANIITPIQQFHIHN